AVFHWNGKTGSLGKNFGEKGIRSREEKGLTKYLKKERRNFVSDLSFFILKNLTFLDFQFIFACPYRFHH
ncbi:MAG TPA: hypothetical protein PKW24_06950, partial [Clostridiales bacterium]|nr:hypothetical protein [Clostridiales bacterium]